MAGAEREEPESRHRLASDAASVRRHRYRGGKTAGAQPAAVWALERKRPKHLETQQSEGRDKCWLSDAAVAGSVADMGWYVLTWSDDFVFARHCQSEIVVASTLTVDVDL
jgi:hypothetical protein